MKTEERTYLMAVSGQPWIRRALNIPIELSDSEASDLIARRIDRDEARRLEGELGYKFGAEIPRSAKHYAVLLRLVEMRKGNPKARYTDAFETVAREIGNALKA